MAKAVSVSYHASMLSVLTTVTAALIWPVLMGGSVAALWWVLGSEVSPALGIVAILTAQFFVLVTLEQLTPVQAKWNVFRDHQTVNNIGHAMLSQVGLQAGTIAALWAALQLSAASGDMGWLWPGGWPFVLQVILGLLIFDFVAYWVHRGYHEVDWMWPVHQLHHALDHMHVLAGARVHFTAYFVTRALALTPLYLMGAPELVLIWVGALNAWTGNLGHSNVRMLFPPGFIYLWVTNQTHHMHHEREMALSNGNYGATLIIYDLLFGSFIHPSRKPLVDIGITEDPVGRNFFLQVISPFIWPFLLIRHRRAQK